MRAVSREARDVGSQIRPNQGPHASLRLATLAADVMSEIYMLLYKQILAFKDIKIILHFYFMNISYISFSLFFVK